MKEISVFIVEDSLLMQKIISDIVSNSEEIKVIGKALTGKEALQKIPLLKPEIVLLDVRLPDLEGLEVLKEVMSKFPTKVVMFSAYTQKGAEITIKALELGAIDFIPKPSGEVSLDIFNFKDEIISKIKLVAGIDMDSFLSIFRGISLTEEAMMVKKIVVIVASTGGPKAIIEIMRRIPSNLSASFLIVQHMPKGFTKSFAERVGWYSQIKVKEAEEGDPLLRGVGYVAPADFHMLVEKIFPSQNKFCIKLDETALVNYLRPSADVTMTSVAELKGKDVIGVILTGMGKDGLEGARMIKEKGGAIIVQDEATSIIYGMPKVVKDAGLADKVLPLEEISEEIVRNLS
ncbi:MAG: hypothetical protein B6D56_03160 [Candidatus Omnitrophica bacterium 4484_70.1]|nr:MAG: hypothetical protein B6D56_03160 [Candidatus Omnitrophica bacterium 4484_70.1]